jgi:hypothetical protein
MWSKIASHISSYTHASISFITKAVLAVFSFSFAILTTISAFLYRYLLLLGLFHVDSIVRPLESVIINAHAVANADNDTLARAEALFDAVWNAYVQLLSQNLDMTWKLCAGLLA